MLVDPADRAERTRTRYVLGSGAAPRLARAVARTATRDPRRFVRALRTASRLSRGSNRPLTAHLAYLAEACVVLEWLSRDHVDHVHTHFGTNRTGGGACSCSSSADRRTASPSTAPRSSTGPTRCSLGEKIHAAAFVVAISSRSDAASCYAGASRTTGTRCESCAAGSTPTSSDRTDTDHRRSAAGLHRPTVPSRRDSSCSSRPRPAWSADGDDFELVLAGDGPAARSDRDRDRPDYGLDRPGADHRLARQRRGPRESCSRPGRWCCRASPRVCRW